MGSLLETMEKTSMFCGLEVKVFFVSHRLLEYVFNMPFEFKFCNNLSKGILRKSAKKHLLHEVVDKKNFEDFLKKQKNYTTFWFGQLMARLQMLAYLL